MGAGDMQRSMYEAVAVPAITELMEGYNTTILAYGQTGSGKTHTMLSSEDEVGAEGQVRHASAIQLRWRTRALKRRGRSRRSRAPNRRTHAGC